MTKKPRGEAGISNEVVKQKTGKSWDAWFKLLDDWGAIQKEHKAIAQYLVKHLRVDLWWAQTVTVRYEQERGLRVLGQRADGSFEFSVQRTIKATPEKAYDAFTKPNVLSKWFTTSAESELKVGGSYSNSDGDKGQYLCLDRPSRLRFTWDNEQRCPGTVVEITFKEHADQKIQVRIQHMKLKSQTDYEDMKLGWSWAIDSFKSYLETRSPIPFESWNEGRDR